MFEILRGSAQVTTSIATTSDPKRKQDRAITFLTQEEVQRLFSVIKNKRDRAIFAVAYRHH